MMNQKCQPIIIMDYYTKEKPGSSVLLPSALSV